MRKKNKQLTSAQAVTVQRVVSPPALKPPIRKNGVLIPADNSFEAINSFVHASPEYEELQWALLGIAASLEKATARKEG